jgi:hypothetical protein
MMDDKREWGEFSEWLERINACIEAEKALHNMASEPPAPEEDWHDILASVLSWVQQYEDAPITTWHQELWVRGFDFAYEDSLSDEECTDSLWKLIHALAGMRIFITNSDHLSDRLLFKLLVTDHLTQPVPQVAVDPHCCCVIDIVGAEILENPAAWLSFYATSRERMEWAKQNPGKPLPPAKKPPFFRDGFLPKP